MKTAIIHDWLITYGGAERVLEEIYQCRPGDIFTLAASEKIFDSIRLGDAKVSTSFLQRVPQVQKHYRLLMPLFPTAIESLDISSYDLVLSSSHAVAKGVITGPDQLHISYVNSTMPYIWQLKNYYLKQARIRSGPKRWLAEIIMHYMRAWDVSSAGRVDQYIANSQYTARIIRKLYNKEAHVIYPPVDLQSYQLCHLKESYYVALARFVPFKRLDTIIAAFAELPDRKLIVIGDGPESENLKRMAARNVEFLGYLPPPEIARYLGKARGMITASEVEPFGITAVEAQACGTPVIAYGKGGALETVIDGETGLFFDEQSPESLARAIRKFESMNHLFDPGRIREHAAYFSQERFRSEFKRFVDSAVERHFGKTRNPLVGVEPARPEPKHEKYPLSHVG